MFSGLDFTEIPEALHHIHIVNMQHIQLAVEGAMVLEAFAI